MVGSGFQILPAMLARAGCVRPVAEGVVRVRDGAARRLTAAWRATLASLAGARTAMASADREAEEE